jgi:hypothetical protein
VLLSADALYTHTGGDAMRADYIQRDRYAEVQEQERRRKARQAQLGSYWSAALGGIDIGIEAVSKSLTPEATLETLQHYLDAGEPLERALTLTRAYIAVSLTPQKALRKARAEALAQLEKAVA